MTNSINSALNAYQQALGRIGAKLPAAEPQPAAKSGFQDIVEQALTTTVDVSRKSEQTAISGISGKADIQDVVLAVSNAQMALETVVAVRDPAIKAYKEILSMPL